MYENVQKYTAIPSSYYADRTLVVNDVVVNTTVGVLNKL